MSNSEQLAEIAKKVRALCVGYPSAAIKWPHRDLHKIADEIDAIAKATS